MNHLLIVAAGGALGAGLRHLANLAALRWFGPGFPWGTLGVNVAGCFAMGMCVELLARRYGGSSELRLFVTTGILGGFTTFSAFSLDFAVLFERGVVWQAAAYAFVSVSASLVALFAGLCIIRAIVS